MNDKCDTDVAAVIITYNPDIPRLEENINSVSKQVDKIWIVDNGSKNIVEIKELQQHKEFELIENGTNFGMAKGLNIGINCALKSAYKWVLTLDQDSICPAYYIEKATQLLEDNNVGLIVPVLYESKSKVYHYQGDKTNDQEFQIVHKGITSASITNTYIWKTIGGFDEEMFIDYVDYDYALRVRKNGYKIVRINDAILDHRMGDSQIRRFGVFKIRVANHNSFRKYYISRNIIIFIKKHGREAHPFLEFLRLLKVIVITLLFEDDKKNKIISIKRGIASGLRYTNKKNI